MCDIEPFEVCEDSTTGGFFDSDIVREFLKKS